MAEDAAFAEFYRAHYRGVVAQLYAYTGNLGEAQESAQEAFIRAWTRWNRIVEYDEPRAWVCRVGYRVAISRWRRARTAAEIWRRERPPTVEPAPDGMNADLVAALRRLPEPQRRAIVLHYLGGFSVAEIASMDGVATGTIKSRLSRARDSLAGLLGGYGPAPPAGTAHDNPHDDPHDDTGGDRDRDRPVSVALRQVEVFGNA